MPAATPPALVLKFWNLRAQPKTSGPYRTLGPPAPLFRNRAPRRFRGPSFSTRQLRSPFPHPSPSFQPSGLFAFREVCPRLLFVQGKTFRTRPDRNGLPGSIRRKQKFSPHHSGSFPHGGPRALGWPNQTIVFGTLSLWLNRHSGGKRRVAPYLLAPFHCDAKKYKSFTVCPPARPNRPHDKKTKQQKKGNKTWLGEN